MIEIEIEIVLLMMVACLSFLTCFGLLKMQLTSSLTASLLSQAAFIIWQSPIDLWGTWLRVILLVTAASLTFFTWLETSAESDNYN